MSEIWEYDAAEGGSQFFEQKMPKLQPGEVVTATFIVSPNGGKAISALHHYSAQEVTSLGREGLAEAVAFGFRQTWDVRDTL